MIFFFFWFFSILVPKILRQKSAVPIASRRATVSGAITRSRTTENASSSCRSSPRRRKSRRPRYGVELGRARRPRKHNLSYYDERACVWPTAIVRVCVCIYRAQTLLANIWKYSLFSCKSEGNDRITIGPEIIHTKMTNQKQNKKHHSSSSFQWREVVQSKKKRKKKNVTKSHCRRFYTGVIGPPVESWWSEDAFTAKRLTFAEGGQVTCAFSLFSFAPPPATVWHNNVYRRFISVYAEARARARTMLCIRVFVQITLYARTCVITAEARERILDSLKNPALEYWQNREQNRLFAFRRSVYLLFRRNQRLSAFGTIFHVEYSLSRDRYFR